MQQLIASRRIRRKRSRACWAACCSRPTIAWASASRSSRAAREVFYDLRHQTIFNALVEMYDKREAIDVITLQQRLKDKHLLEQVGGIAYLASLARCRAVGGQPELLPGHRAGEISAAENDPHLHGRGGAGLRLRRRSGRVDGRGGARHSAHQRIAGAEPDRARSRNWSTRRSTPSKIFTSGRAC